MEPPERSEPPQCAALPPERALGAVVRRLHASVASLPHVVERISELAVSWSVARACAFPGHLPLLKRLLAEEHWRPGDPHARDASLVLALAAAAGRGDLEAMHSLSYSGNDRMPIERRIGRLWWIEIFTPGVEAAVAGNHWHALEWLELRSHHLKQIGMREMQLAAENGSQQVLEALFANRGRMDYNCYPFPRLHDLSRWLRASVEGGHLAAVKFLAAEIDMGRHNRSFAAPKDLKLCLRAPATNGNLDVLQWLNEAGFPWLHLVPSAEALQGAAGNGHLEVVQWLLALGATESGAEAKAIDNAAANGHLDVVCWLHDTGQFKFTAEAMSLSALNGHLAVVRWLHEHWGDKSDRALHAMDNAAASGHLDIVQFLHTHRQDGCSTAAMDGAAANGHFAVVKWLSENRSEGCSHHAMDGAAANGHLAIAQWLLRHFREDFTTKAMDGAAANGRLSVVRWLDANRSEGCTTDAMDGAAANGHLLVVEWLHRHRSEGCTTRAMDEAATNGRLRVVKWLHEHRLEGCTTRAMDGAAGNAHFPVLLFLRSQRREGCSRLAFTSAFLRSHMYVLRWLECHYPAQFDGQHALRQPGAIAVHPLVSNWALRRFHRATVVPSLCP